MRHAKADFRQYGCTGPRKTFAVVVCGSAMCFPQAEAVSYSRTKFELGNHMSALITKPAHSLIEHTKGVCGGKARVAGTRIAVWGLEAARRIGLSDSQIILRYPAVSKQALAQAWEYVEQNSDEINADINDNEG